MLEGFQECFRVAADVVCSRESTDNTTQSTPCTAVSSLREALPSGKDRIVHTCMCDASAAASADAASGQQQLAAVTSGAAAVLLHITKGDDPNSAHQRLHTALESLGCGVQV